MSAAAKTHLPETFRGTSSRFWHTLPDRQIARVVAISGNETWCPCWEALPLAEQHRFRWGDATRPDTWTCTATLNPVRRGPEPSATGHGQVRSREDIAQWTCLAPPVGTPVKALPSRRLSRWRRAANSLRWRAASQFSNDLATAVRTMDCRSADC